MTRQTRMRAHTHAYANSDANLQTPTSELAPYTRQRRCETIRTPLADFHYLPYKAPNPRFTRHTPHHPHKTQSRLIPAMPIPTCAARIISTSLAPSVANDTQQKRPDKFNHPDGDSKRCICYVCLPPAPPLGKLTPDG